MKFLQTTVFRVLRFLLRSGTCKKSKIMEPKVYLCKDSKGGSSVAAAFEKVSFTWSDFECGKMENDWLP